MRITDSQRERLQWGAEELRSLAHLLEEIISRNPSSSGEELMAMNRLAQLVRETSSHLKAIQRQDDLATQSSLRPLTSCDISRRT
jgi:hypothetical protein